MANNLFRKKSLDKVNSPEQLDSTFKIMSKGNWILCIALIFAIAGFVVWGCVGKLKSYVYGVADVQEKQIICYLDTTDFDKISDGQDCVINNVSFKTNKNAQKPTVIDDIASEYVIYKGGFYYGQYVNTLIFENKDVKVGIYTVEITIQDVSPFSFLF